MVTKNTLSPRRLPTTKRNTSISSGKDDRNTFITGKKPEHPEDVEDKATKMGSPTKSKVKMGESGNINAPRRTGRRNGYP